VWFKGSGKVFNSHNNLLSLTLNSLFFHLFSLELEPECPPNLEKTHQSKVVRCVGHAILQHNQFGTIDSTMVPFFETQLANQTRPGKLKPNFLLTSHHRHQRFRRCWQTSSTRSILP
jgi:hypothetical protein